MKRLIQEQQYSTLQKVLEELEEFCKFMEKDAEDYHEKIKSYLKFVAALRELNWLVEDIDRQEVKENE